MKRKILSVLLVLTVAFSVSAFFDQGAEAADNTIRSSNIGYPSHLYVGTGFVVSGHVKSSSALSQVKAGVMNKKGSWKSGYCKSVDPKSKTYDLSKMDSSIPIRKLGAGTYYYAVYARTKSGRSKTLLKKKFTMSKIYTSGVSKPSNLKKGSGFVVKGKVCSEFKLKTVRAGICTSKGTWISGKNFSSSPGSKTYDLSKMDSKIKFGTLSKGTYYYKVKGVDAYGKSTSAVSKKFKVVAVASSSGANTSSSSSEGIIYAGGKTLSYSSGHISRIGAQPVSGPCGIYAMAYSRTVIDGYFSHPSYSWLIRNYGCGGFSAHWYKAGGSSCYYSSAKLCYKTALRQLAKGKPCIINLRNGYTGNQHYVTVIGYKAGTTYDNVKLSSFVALDPGYGVKKNLSSMKYYDHSSPQCITF